MVVKIIVLQKVMLHYVEKESILMFNYFWLCEFHNSLGTKK